MEAFKEFNIQGIGETQAEAAKSFMKEFHKQFPKMKGLYDLMLKSPLTYDLDLDGNHTYLLKGNTTQLVNLELKNND